MIGRTWSPDLDVCGRVEGAEEETGGCDRKKDSHGVASRAEVRRGIGSLLGSVDETGPSRRGFEVKTGAEWRMFSALGEQNPTSKIYKRVRTRFINAIINSERECS